MSEAQPDTPLPSSPRDALRAKIDAAERRIEERTFGVKAREAAEAAGDYARAHPLTVVLGALAIGIAIGAMTRPGRRFYGQVAAGAASGASEAVSAVGGAATAVSGAAARAASNMASGTASGLKRAAAKPASRLGTAVFDWAIAYFATLIEDALDAARTGQDRIEDLGGEATTRARQVGRGAANLVGTTADNSRALARRTQRKAVRALRDLAGR